MHEYPPVRPEATLTNPIGLLTIVLKVLRTDEFVRLEQVAHNRYHTQENCERRSSSRVLGEHCTTPATYIAPSNTSLELHDMILHSKYFPPARLAARARRGRPRPQTDALRWVGGTWQLLRCAALGNYRGTLNFPGVPLRRGGCNPVSFPYTRANGATKAVEARGRARGGLRQLECCTRLPTPPTHERRLPGALLSAPGRPATLRAP